MSRSSLLDKIALVLLAVMVIAIVSGCAPAPTPVPTAAPPTAAPKPTNVPPTSAPAATSVPATSPPVATSAPATTAPTATAVAKAQATNTAPASAQQTTLIVGVAGDMTGWDPAQSVFALANEIIINTHDQLIDSPMTTDSFGNPVRDNTKFIPKLAQTWEVSADGTVFTFRLRKDVKFNNGDPLNAQAVKASFEYQLKVPASSFRLNNIAGLTDPSQIVADDEYTVSFHLKAPNNLFLKAFTKPNYTIVNAKRIVASGATLQDQMKWATTNVTGSGPYVIDSFQPGVQLVLKANPNYWGSKPYFQQVIYKVVPDATNRELLLRNGDIDIAYDVPLKDFTTLKSDPKLKAYATPTFGITYMHFNTQMKPWDNALLRQAVGYAIPYDTIIQQVTYGFARPAQSWIAPGLEGFIAASPYKYDLNKAKDLLTQAGYPGGKGLPPLTFNLKQGVPEEEQTAVYIQAELAKIGVTMDIQPLTVATHADLIGKHQLPWTFNYFLPYVPDAYYQMYYNFTIEKAPSGCCNYSSYQNKQVDALVISLRTEVDPAKRVAATQDAQKLIAQDAPSIPLYSPTWNVAMRSTVSGYSFFSDALIRFAELSRVSGQ